MSDAALIASAALLGLAGTPHCAAMCAAPCAAASGKGWRDAWAFQLARVAGYAAAGAVAAGSVGALGLLAQWSPALRPLWVMLHALVLALGLWLLWQGRQPAWMGALGRVPVQDPGVASSASVWRPIKAPIQAASAGALWVAWPCGLLQSALLVSSLAGTPLSGAGAMAAFAAASSGGLLAAPWVWRRLRGAGGRGARAEPWLVRGAGGLLVLGSVFALGGGVWHSVAAYCGLA